MSQRISGRKRQERNRRILAASNVCHICGHPGSDAVDHVQPLGPVQHDPIEFARRDNDMANLKPAHHDVPCPTCGRRCNREKSDKAWAPIVRRSTSLNRP